MSDTFKRQPHGCRFLCQKSKILYEYFKFRLVLLAFFVLSCYNKLQLI